MSEEAKDNPKESEVLSSLEEAIKKEVGEDEEMKGKETTTLNESIDELKCIQQEMEDLKNENETGMASSSSKEEKKNSTLVAASDSKNNTEDDSKPLERDDLIAVLTGGEKEVPKKTIKNVKGPSPVASQTMVEAADIPEDVEIEGEGSFKIMEVVDEEEYTDPILPVVKTLTVEEERAIAMQQMADLNSKPRGARNKQEIVKQSLNVAQAIGAEWSEDENPPATEKPQKDIHVVVVQKPNNDNLKKVAEKPKSSPLVTNVIVVPPAAKTNKAEIAKAAKETKEVSNSVQAAPSETSGFKRQRIIKRKIIWDPDAPETAISYAQLARAKNTPEAKTKLAATAAAATGTGAKVIASNVPKKEVIKKVQVVLPKDKAPTKTQSLAVARANTPLGRTSTPVGRTATPTEQPANAGKSVIANVAVVAKKRPQTPVANGAGGKKKKVMSEIEKLMGDEGAANMLNDVKRNENSESPDGVAKTTGRARVSEKVTKVTKQTAGIARKDSPTMAKAKRAPKSQAAQWDYVYKHKVDDNLIIRRRSNSSYSSNASLNRTSLDAPITTPKTTPKATTPTPSSSALTTESPTTSTTTATATVTKANQTKAAKANVSTISAPIPVTVTKNSNKKNFEFIKPQNKQQNQQEQQPEQQPQTTNRRTKAVRATKDQQAKVIVTANSIKKEANGENDAENGEQKSSITAGKSDCIANIEVNINIKRSNFTFTIEILKSLIDHINTFAKDKDVHCLVITFNSGLFWKSFELSTILNEESDKSKHKGIILDWVSAVKNYLTALATFPKALIGSFQGNFFDLGVVQMALFDTIICDEKASFETHYVDLNMLPMGLAFWQNSSAINDVLLKKLFWYGEKLNATEANTLGLVYKISPVELLQIETHIHAEYMTNIHTIMKRKTVKERISTINMHLQSELNAVVEKFSNKSYNN